MYVDLDKVCAELNVDTVPSVMGWKMILGLLSVLTLSSNHLTLVLLPGRVFMSGYGPPQDSLHSGIMKKHQVWR